MALWADLRYGLRALMRSPLFTLVAVVSLALGIGANAAILSVFDQVMLRMLPVRDPEALVIVRSPGHREGNHYSDDGRGTAWSYPMYRDLRDRNEVFDGLIARFGTGFHLAHQGAADRVSAELVSGNYFEVLGVRPALGRLLTREDDLTPGGHPVAVISYAYWKKRFALDPAILNQTIRIGGHPMTLVGAAQEGFFGVQRDFVPAVWVPMAMKTSVMANARPLDRRNDHWLNMFGRLKPAVARAQAEASLAPLFRGLREAEAKEMSLRERARERYVSAPLLLDAGAQGRQNLQDEVRTPLTVTMVIVALVLLIACANVAGLQVARGAARRKEIAVRLAIGASRWVLVRQFFVESLLIALAAGVLSIVVSRITLQGIWLLLPGAEASGIVPQLDLRTLALHFAIALATALGFGLIPAFGATRTGLAHALKDLAAGGARARFRKVLVTAQVALTFTLLALSGLFVRSLSNLKLTETGMRPQQVVRFDVSPGMSGYTVERSREFLRRLLEGLRQTPSVQTASLGTVPLFSGSNSSSNFTIEGYRGAEDEDMHLFTNWTGPAYFATLGIPLIAGREFEERDRANSAKVCVISESTARKFFAGRNPIGFRLVSGVGNVTPDTEIVGVVKDSKHAELRERPRRFVYFPYTQAQPMSATFYVRTESAGAVMPAIHEQVRLLDANIPVGTMRTLEVQIAETVRSDRVMAILAAGFATLAALLAGVGVYGVMAFVVTRRTREIGIRMALGAGAPQVRRLIVSEVALLAGVAVVVGLPAAWALGRVAQSMLFGVDGADVRALAAAVLGVLLVAAAASFLPARRAVRVDPMRTLRQE